MPGGTSGHERGHVLDIVQRVRPQRGQEPAAALEFAELDLLQRVPQVQPLGSDSSRLTRSTNVGRAKSRPHPAVPSAHRAGSDERVGV